MTTSMRLASALLLTAVGVLCQTAGSAPPAGPLGPRGPHGFGPEFERGPRAGKVVANAPYSAAFTNHFVQRLADGNVIERNTNGQIARDSQGRTYEKVTIQHGPMANNGPKTLVFITDPVAGYAYTLNTESKTATQHPLHTRDWPGTNDSPVKPGPGRQGDEADVSAADLGVDSSSGVAANGKRMTRTIPAGAIGNSQPITVTHESWYSPDLQIVVKAIRNDPWAGESTYALTNIVSKEPDPSLFKLPAGYTIQTRGERGAHAHAPGQP